jgi:RND family efflux transporter MFP subunit
MKSTNFPPRKALFLAAALALAAGCRGATPPEEEHLPPAPVKAVSAREVKIGEWTELLGTTQPLPDRVARVSAAVEGHVVSVLGDGKGPPVVEGQQVKAGQVIVQLDDRVAQANKDKLSATLDELTELKRQADYGVQLAELEVRRLEDLGKSAGGVGSLPSPVSRVEMEKARIAVQDARSKAAAVTAREKSLRAELRSLDAQLHFYTLRAPIAGRLGLLQAVPGQTLTPGTTVAEVIDLDEIDALCFVPPRTATRLALGQPARAAGAKTAAGKVTFIAVQAQPETGNFAVKVRFPNRDLSLRANAVLRVEILTQPEKERLTIPEAALLEDQEPPLVVVAAGVAAKKNDEGKEDKVGKARRLRPVLGVRDRRQHLVEVLRLEPLEKGEQVAPRQALFIVEGAHGLQDGDEVKLEEEEHK